MSRLFPGRIPGGRPRARQLQLERLEDRRLFSGVPVAAANVPANEFINEGFNFSVAFSNSGTTAGFGPFVDVVVARGINVTAASYEASGLTLRSVGFWDVADNRWETLANGGGTAVTTHPLNDGISLVPDPYGMGAGDQGAQLFAVQLPFGSFVPTQPTTTINFTASIDEPNAQVGVPLTVKTRGGFIFGQDALSNPSTDPPTLQAVQSTTITPTVIELTKSVDAAEGETAAGPNFPRTYSLTLDVANNKTVGTAGENANQVVFTDLVPSGFTLDTAFGTGGVQVAGSGGATLVSASIVGNTLRVEFDAVTGTLASDEIIVRYRGFVAETVVPDAAGNDDTPLVNAAAVSGAVDGNAVSDTANVTLTGKQLAIQKGVSVTDLDGSGGASAGDRLTWTLNFQVSDFDAFGNLVLTDTLSDGLDFNFATANTRIVTVSENGSTLGPFNFAAGNVSAVINANGTTTLTLRLSDELAATALGSTLSGDKILDGSIGSGPTAGTISFETVILENFRTTFPSGDASVDVGDVLTNDVTISGVSQGGHSETDSSSASVKISDIAVQKSVYAINGVLLGAADPLIIKPGDLVTYHLQVTLPTADTENFVVTDFLPLPVFNLATTGAFTFDATLPSAVGYNALAPAVAVAKFGPLHTLNDQTFSTTSPNTPPLITIAGDGSNSIKFDFGTFDAAPPSAPIRVDILFTVQTTDLPFADGLLLTNQLQASYGTTGQNTVSSTAIVQIELTEPTLSLTKGVVSATASGAVFSPSGVGPVAFTAPNVASNPFTGTFTSANLAATPIDSNVRGIDAGDRVKFAIVVENTGGADAFDVLLHDVLPSGFGIPGSGLGLNLQVFNGAGIALGFAGDLFAAGLSITDPGAGEGAINGKAAADLAGNGSNIIVITYDLSADNTVRPGTVPVNNARLSEFSAREGGTDFTAVGDEKAQWSDTATVTIATPSVDKSIVSTSIAATGSAELNAGRVDLVVGEQVTYQVVIHLGEGTTVATLTDNLPAALASGFLGVVSSRVVSIGGNTTLGATSGGNLSGVGLAVGASGVASNSNFTGDAVNDRVVFSLGTVLNNADNISNANDEIVVEITALVVDVAANANADVLTNTATLNFVAGSASNTIAVDIVEPKLDIQKSVLPVTADAGDIVTYTITVQHEASSHATAHDVLLSDLLTPGLSLIAGSVTASAGSITTGNTVGDTTVAINIDTLPKGSPLITITYQATVTNSVSAGARLVNTAGITWNSIDGGGGRTSSDTDPATLSISAPGLTKAVVDSSVTDTGSNRFNTTRPDLAIGELVTYQMTLSLREGMTVATLTDDLPASLATGILSVVSSRVVSIGGNTTGGATTGGNLTGSTLAVGASGVANNVNFSGDAHNDRVLFNFGNVLNTPDNVANGLDQIVVEIVARVENVGANTSGDSLVNRASLNYGNGTVAATAAVDVVEPQLDIQKTATPNNGDAGDLITYTLTLSHTAASQAAAYGLVISDILQSDIRLVAGSVTASTGTITTGNGGGDTSVRIDLATYTLGSAPVTITYQGQLQNTVVSGTNESNTVNLSYGSLPGGGGRQYSDSDSEKIAIGVPNLIKSNVSTSVAATGTGAFNPAIDDLTVGETVTFNLRVQLQEGTVRAIVTDNLPTIDGVLSLVSSQVLSIGGNISGSLLAVGASGVASDINLVDSLNDRVVFDFGTVINAADGVVDGNDEILIQVVARVADVAANTSADRLTNRATLDFGTGSVSDTSVVEVVAPALDITKSVLPTFGDAGDTMTYSLNITHATNSSGPAFDVAVIDLLAANLNLVAGSVLSTHGVVTLGNGGGDTTVRIDVAELALGESITVTFDVVLDNAVTPASSELNTATLAYDSLPGAGGRASTDSASQSVQVGTPNFRKEIVATSEATTGSNQGDSAITDLAIGELVTFRLVAHLQEGTSTLLVTDNLPSVPGVLSIQSASVVSIGGNIAGSSLAVGAGGTRTDTNADTFSDRVVFDFGTVTNAADNASDAADEIIIEIVARVENITANQAGDVMTNNATLDFGSGSLGAAATVEIVEPVLTTTKTLLSASANVDAGDTVSYEILIQHTGASNADALDVNLLDSLPTALRNLQIVSASLGGLDVAADFLINGSEQLASVSPFTVVLGQTLRIVVSGVVQNDINPGATIANTVNVTWSSLTGSNPGSERAGGGGVNDYAASSAAPLITVPGVLDVSKTVSAATARVGGIVTYTLVVRVAEGTTTNLVLADTLANGLVYLGDAAVTTNASSMVFSGFTTSLLGQALQLSFASVTNAGNVDDANGLDSDTFTITYTARVADLPAVQSGTVLSNDVDASADGGLSDQNNQTTTTVIEPRLTVNKVASDPTPHYGQLVTYTVTIEHDLDANLPDSTDTAFDLVIRDLVNDPAYRFVAGSVVLVTDDAVNTQVVTGNGAADASVVITADSFALGVGQQIVFTYQVRTIANSTAAPLGTQLDNTVNLQFDTQPGTNANARTTTVSDNAALIMTGADLSLVKTDGGRTSVTPGETFTYTLTVTNKGTDTATRVVVTDTLPSGLVFAGSTDVAFVSFSGGVVRFELAGLAQGAQRAFTFDVSLPASAPAGLRSPSAFVNTAQVRHRDLDPTPNDNRSTDTNALNAAPDLAIVKRVLTPIPSDGFPANGLVQYTLTITNAGNQDASGVTVVDSFPTQSLVFVSASESLVRGADDHFHDLLTPAVNGAGQLRWDLDTVPAGETVVITLTARVRDPLPILVTSFTNNARVDDDGTSNDDPQPRNNSTAVVAPLVARPDLVVTKTDNVDVVRGATPLIYVIEVANIGTQDSTNILVVDRFQTGVFAAVVASDGGVVDMRAGTVTWTLPFLAGAGDSRTLHVTATLAQPTTAGLDTVRNEVSVSDDGTNGPDFNPGNNNAADSSELQLFVYDSVRNPLTNALDAEDDAFHARLDKLQYTLPPLPVSPLYSGWAEPGSTLDLKMYDQHGNLIGSQAVMADTGGNWVATFPSVVVTDRPYAIDVTQTQSVQSMHAMAGFNLRTYFSPAVHAQMFWSHHATPTSVLAYQPSNVLEAMLAQDSNPLGLDWNSSYSYEYLAASGTPSQYAH